MRQIAKKGAALIQQEIVLSEKLVVKYDLFFRNPLSCYAANEHNKFSKTFFGSSKQSLLKAMMYSVLLCGKIPSLPVIHCFFFTSLVDFVFVQRAAYSSASCKYHSAYFSFLNKALYRYSRHQNTTCEHQHTFIINVLFNR